jgi:hypothetical protein
MPPATANGRAIAKANVQPPPNPAGAGNGRAVSSGVHSQAKLAPVRERYARDLRERYPSLDDLRLAMLADRLARIELATTWLDGKGTIFRNRRSGLVFDVVDRLERWASRVEQIVADLEREQHGERIPLAVALSEPNPVIRAALLRQLGLKVGTLPEEAEGS